MADTKGIRAGRAFVELGVSDKLTKGLQAAEKRLKAFGEGLRSVGTKLAAIGGTALTALFGTAKTFADMGDSLDEMSARTGVSVETLSELGFAADLAGVDMETLETGIRKMQKTISEAIGGSQTAADAIGQLGLSVTDLKNLSPEQQFKLIADRISKIQDPTLRAAAAMEVFGKSGTRLLPLIQDGAKGLAKFQEQARALGLTISTQAAKDASVLADALDILWKVIKQAAFTIGSALAPTVSELAGKVTRAVVAFSEWIKQNKAVVVTVFQVVAGVAAAGAALFALGVLVSGLGAALGGLATVVTGIGTAFGVIGSVIAALVSPIGLAITAVAALGTAILVYTGAGADALAWLGEQFTWLRDAISKVMGGITDALTAGDITLAAQILWLALKLAWQEGVAALNRVWLEAKRFFIGTAQAMWFGALALAQQVFHALEVAWIETTAFLSKTWTNFTSDVQEAWHLVQNWLTKRWIDLMNLFGDLTDEQAQHAKDMADQDFADTAGGIEKRRSGALTEREQRRQSERDQSAAVNEATLAEIGKQFDEAQKALDSATGDKVAETQRRLAEARKQFGVETGDIRALAKKIKSNHELALQLWKTGNIDAQLLAILLMKPKSLSAAELDKMVRAARFAWVADWFNAYIVKEQPPADKETLRIKWMKDEDGWAARAGWNLTASKIGKGAEGLDLPALLDRIESEMAAAPPETQWTMNAVLANIGIHDAKLRKRAIAIGEKLGIYRDYPCSKGCTSPFAPIWINEMVKRQG